MSGKSLDDVWRKMQAQRIAEQQRIQQIERANEERRERERREYLNRMRMFERAAPVSSSSSAGAGGGGRNPSNTITQISTQQSVLFSKYSQEDNLFSFFIYNFTDDILTDIKTISAETFVYIMPVSSGGFLLYEETDEINVYKFVDLLGNVVWSDQSINRENYIIENYSSKLLLGYNTDSSYKLVLIKEQGIVKEETFNTPAFVTPADREDFYNGGVFVYEQIDGENRRYYYLTDNNFTKIPLKELDQNTTTFDVYASGISEKFITSTNNLFESWSSSGKITEIDMNSELETNDAYVYDSRILPDNNSAVFLIRDVQNTKYVILYYSGISDTFTYRVVDGLIYQEYYYEIDNQKDVFSPRREVSEGACIFVFYDTINDDLDETYFFENSLVLPLWSDDTEIRDFYVFTENGVGPGMVIDNSNPSIIRKSNIISIMVEQEGNTNQSIMKFLKDSNEPTVEDIDIAVNENIWDITYLKDRTLVTTRVTSPVIGVSPSYSTQSGWNDLSDVENRLYYSLNSASSWGDMSQLVNNEDEIIMKDIVNDQYWGIKFLSWDDNGNGDFSYSRQLIENGTFSGEPIIFTFSLQDNVADVISEGVLEIKRKQYNLIYNSAEEGESNGYNPKGTLWNNVNIVNYLVNNGFITYKHYIFDENSDLVGSPVETSEFETFEEGSTIVVNDRINCVNHISNETNNKQFFEIEDYFDDYDSIFNNNDTYFESSSMLLYSGISFKLITKDNTYPTIKLDQINETTNSYIEMLSNSGFIFGLITNDSDYRIFHYNNQCELIGQVDFTQPENVYPSFYSVGNIMYYTYTENDVRKYVFFDGTKIVNYENDFIFFNRMSNSFQDWWD